MTNTSGPRVFTEVIDNTGYLVFDHEARLNAMTRDMWASVPQLCATLDSDPTVKVIVIRGAGTRAFVAGADINQFSEQRTPENAEDYNTENESAYTAIKSISKPVVAMINGVCIGGGLAIALCADIRYGSDDSRYALPPAKLGLGYAASGIADLVDLLGPSVTKELVFTADKFDATEALRWGLLNRVVPKADLEDFVRCQCATIASRAPLTQAAAKLAVADHLCEAKHKQPSKISDAITTCMSSQDYAEGVSAFLAKRPADFKGL